MNWGAIANAIKISVRATSDTDITFVREGGSWADDDNSNSGPTVPALIEYKNKDSSSTLANTAVLTVGLIDAFTPAMTDKITFRGHTWTIDSLAGMGVGQPIGWTIGVKR